MINISIGALIAVMLTAAVIYIVKTKKKGNKCIGCPAAGCCSAMKESQAVCSSVGSNDGKKK